MRRCRPPPCATSPARCSGTACSTRPRHRPPAGRGGPEPARPQPAAPAARLVHAGDAGHRLRDVRRHGGGGRARQEPLRRRLLRRPRRRAAAAGGRRPPCRVRAGPRGGPLPGHPRRHGADRAHPGGGVPDEPGPGAVDPRRERARPRDRSAPRRAGAVERPLAVHRGLGGRPGARRAARPGHRLPRSVVRAGRGAPHGARAAGRDPGPVRPAGVGAEPAHGRPVQRGDVPDARPRAAGRGAVSRPLLLSARPARRLEPALWAAGDDPVPVCGPAGGRAGGGGRAAGAPGEPPRLDRWTAVRRRWDPALRLRSAQSVRVLGDPA